MSVLSKIPARLWKVLPETAARTNMRTPLLNSRLLLTALLTTCAECLHPQPSFADSLTTPPPGCCIVTPLTYSQRYWAHQTCLAGDILHLHYRAHNIGLDHSRRLIRALTTGTEGEDECHHWYDIDTKEFVDMVKKNEQGVESMLLIDVREPEELVETGEIPGSINIPLGEVEDAFNLSTENFQANFGVEKPVMDDPRIVFSCRSGIRSLSAMEAVHHLGYGNARHYMRGWLGWEEHLEHKKR